MQFAMNRSVSLVLGGNVFGWTADRDASFQVLDAYLDHGGALVDTADSYSQWAPGNRGGESERILGEWIAARPEPTPLVIASKVGQSHRRPGLSAENIRAAVHDSLERLGASSLGLYFAHFDEDGRPIEEIARAFSELRAEGLVEEIGVSNLGVERISGWLDVAAREGLYGPTVIQKEYSLVERGIEVDVLPLAQQHGLTVQTYYSLARGFLAGKYRDGTVVDSPRAQVAAGYLDDRGRAVLAELDAVAARHDASVSAVSLAWLATRPTVGGVIASARTLEQLAGLVEATRLTLDPEDVSRLDEVSQTPQSVTDAG
ncbi:aldo/keto reductase [Pseudonocardia sichuanensis]